MAYSLIPSFTFSLSHISIVALWFLFVFNFCSYLVGLNTFSWSLTRNMSIENNWRFRTFLVIYLQKVKAGRERWGLHWTGMFFRSVTRNPNRHSMRPSPLNIHKLQVTLPSFIHMYNNFDGVSLIFHTFYIILYFNSTNRTNANHSHYEPIKNQLEILHYLSIKYIWYDNETLDWKMSNILFALVMHESRPSSQR